jgi:cation transport regulator ChaC
MTLTVPATTLAILDEIETARQPSVDYEISGKLSGLHRAHGLTEAERRGAWAEASAFNFTLMDESPWHTRYGPDSTAIKADGTPRYAPDIAEIDEEIITHWEHRSSVAQHPILRARYADLTWDLKKTVTSKPADIQYAQRAIDAYLDGVTAKLYKEPLIHAALASKRALTLALSINDKTRIQQSKQVMLDLFKENAQPVHIGIWATIYDSLIENKKIGLTPEETADLIQGLERILAASTIKGGEQFDPWSAEAAARRLAAYHEQQGKKDEAKSVIRTYGTAFEQLAAEASPMLAMSWLQPIHDEYKNRGMKDDAARVQAVSAEKGKNVASDLKEVRTSVEITDAELQTFVEQITQGTPHDALLRIAADFIPRTEEIKAFLQELLTAAPLMARIGVTRIVGDHFAAQAGSIEADPEGRLIMQLAQRIDIQNFFLHKSIDHLRSTSTITADTILAVLDESPVFTPERRPLLQEGIQAYLDDDHTKAIHVIVPQIEQALRQLLSLTGAPALKTGRNGMMQLKNLNDILREPTIKECLGEDLRLYLLTFLADERGQNIRNTICHGLATPQKFNQGLSDQTLHALMAVSLVRQNATKLQADVTLLFQYGSNCNDERLNSTDRLDGSAKKPVLAETVDEYELAFDVWSKGNGCAASNLIAAPGTGRHAIGILYEVPTDRIRGKREDNKKTMSQIEGSSYEERTVKVRTTNGEVLEAVTFLVKKDAQRPGLWTSSAYVKHIVDGLRTHQAPSEYVQQIIDVAIKANQAADPSNAKARRIIEKETERIRSLRC